MSRSLLPVFWEFHFHVFGSRIFFPRKLHLFYMKLKTSGWLKIKVYMPLQLVRKIIHFQQKNRSHDDCYKYTTTSLTHSLTHHPIIVVAVAVYKGEFLSYFFLFVSMHHQSPSSSLLVHFLRINGHRHSYVLH